MVDGWEEVVWQVIMVGGWEEAGGPASDYGGWMGRSGLASDRGGRMGKRHTYNKNSCGAVMFYFWKQGRRRWNEVSTLLHTPPPPPLAHTALFAQNPYVDNCVLKWFKQARDKKVPVSGPLLRAKAEHFTSEIGKIDFKASAGWLDGVKQRNGISFKAVYNESGAVYVRSADNWKEDLK
uniref:HTH CENPB-type domain-containing protein n=1 Tax=Timema bartmani TaxID=61472 RepID=A0A7R9HYC9_9NEOP|nr:unnamed protein product [Timema bartmani]